MDRLDFPLKGSVTKETVKKAQERLLQIAVVIRDILERNNINYTIMFGTLLGAIRHKGFIPWDLDMDIGIIEEDYDVAMECVKREIPEWLVVQDSESDKNYCAFWSKIVDRNSAVHVTAFEADNKFKYRGLHIDLYKLQRTSRANYEHDRQREAVIYYNKQLKRDLISQEEYEKKTSQIEELLSKTKVCRSKKDCYYFIHLFCSEEKNIFPIKEYEFCGEIFKGPYNFDKVLKDSYYTGDYMVPPPYEDRDLKIDSIELVLEYK